MSSIALERKVSSSGLNERVRGLRRILRRTPIVTLADDNVNLHAKLEQFNGIGSIKDRPAYYVLNAAIARGEICEGGVVVESSSGNFAIALAVFCRMLGLEFVPVIDPNITPSKRSLLQALCRRVVTVSAPDDSGGYLKTRLRAVRDFLAECPGSFWPNQYGNPEGMRAHYELTAGEICDGLPNLDFVFVGVSSAGTIAGLSRRLKERYPHVEVIAVDVDGSAIFGATPEPRFIPGIGSSIVPDLLKHAIVDDVVSVSEFETIESCLELFTRHDLFVGGSSGSAFAAIKRSYKRMAGGTARTRPDVLFLCCDGGLDYLDTVYNAAWREWRKDPQRGF